LTAKAEAGPPPSAKETTKTSNGEDNDNCNGEDLREDLLNPTHRKNAMDGAPDLPGLV
jgi:hypothetical protein